MTPRPKGAYSGNTEYHDASFDVETAVSNDNYSTTPDSGFNDRVYDVRGLSALYAEIHNTDSTNSLRWKVMKARKNFTQLSDLVDADFVEEKAEATVTNGNRDDNSVIRVDSEITALRIMLRNAVAAQSVDCRGIFSVR